MIPTLKDTKKKGGLHTIEAVIAFITVLTFIIFVMPNLVDREDASAVKRNYVYGALSNLEASGKLSELAVAENLSGIAVELNRTLTSPVKFTVGMSILNVTAGTIHPEEGQPDYINFAANMNALDSSTLELEYINTTNPAVRINGDEIANHTGDYSGTSETLDLTPGVIQGANSVSVETSNNATINYRLRIMTSIELTSRPAGRTINTVNYMIAGDKNALTPMEVRVYIWQ